MQLMEAVRDGELAQLGVLFERHHRRLYGFCRRLTGSPVTAEDLVQEIFMRLLRYRESYRPGAEFAPWMYTLARNACLDHLRSRPLAAATEVEMDERSSPEPGAFAETAGREEVRLLQRAFRRLSAAERELLVLARLEGRRYQEIAELLECSVGAVKVRVHRAVRRLQELVRDLAGEVVS
jgi:RNA polymerase sigma-70 factor (ECF subfamily)